MLYINKITKDPQQEINLNGIPGLNIGMTLRFMPRIQSWTMGITYNGLSYQGIGIVICENLLRQYQADLPFGIACIRADGLDPYTVNVNQCGDGLPSSVCLNTSIIGVPSSNINGFW